MGVRIGVIGAGAHSRQMHGPALRAVAGRAPGRVELAAVCDLDGGKAAAYAEAFGFARSYGDIDAMLGEQSLDAVVAVTPIAHTEAIVSRLLPRRIPLLVEKPPGESAAATARLLALARRHRTPHMVSFNRRFNPALVEARAWIDREASDRPPRLVLGRMLRAARTEARFVVGTGIHLVDAVLSMVGPAASVDVRRLATAQPGAHLSCAQLECTEDRAAVLVISPTVGAMEETLEIHGEGYCLLVDIRDQSVELRKGHAVAWRWSTPASREREFQDAIGETLAFVEAVEGGRPYGPDLAAALHSMRVAQAIEQGESARFDIE